jgi:putative N6-adenine-specific DNA methylase
MSVESGFEIFLVAIPGLEAALAAEAKARGFKGVRQIAGGVVLTGGWPEVWRANLELRGASRVLARIGAFHAAHLAQLDKRARAFPWKSILRRDVSVAVEAACRKSKIYHSGAAAERIATAIREELGAPIDKDAGLVIKARIEKDLCTLSVDTSGDMLHKRGSKQAMAKAPMRETMAALFLRECGFDGGEPVLDPMCGAGTFVIEAAEIAMGLHPGRNRSFAFEQLATFDAKAWDEMKARHTALAPQVKFHGSDRDEGAIRNAIANAARSGVGGITVFEKKVVSEISPPQGPPGLVICNPPYGTRIGDKSKLVDLYSAFGNVLKERFHGWRVGLITGDTNLAKATGLPFKGKPHAVLHGGLRVHLFRTGTL